MLTGLADYIIVTSHLYRIEPPKNTESIPAFFEQTERDNYQEEVLRSYRYDPNCDCFRDYWGNPIRLVVESRHDYRFISAGANGKYENGQGDDIVYCFDPLEPNIPKE